VNDFNVGLIGSGRIGQVHAGSIADTKGANLAWVCDPFIEGAEKLAAEFGGQVTADPEDVFTAGNVDVIVVASPTPTHLDMIDRAIDAGIHVDRPRHREGWWRPLDEGERGAPARPA